MIPREQGAGGAPSQTVRIELSWRSVVSIVALVVGLWLLALLWQIILIVVIALVLAGTLSPVVDRLEQRRLTRAMALGLVAVGMAAAVVGLGFLVLPALIAQVTDTIRLAPQLQEQLAETAAAHALTAGVAAEVRAAQPARYLAPLGEAALGYAAAAVEWVAYGVTAVVLAFYILADRERVTGFLYALLPRRYHLRTARIMLDLETIVGGYMRGQALTSLCMGGFMFVLLSVLGVPNALALAAFAAFTDLIPFIGGFLVTIPAVLAALTVGVVPAIIVWGAIVLYQEFESRYLVLRVYGQALRLSPVAVTIALLAGGKLLGIVGALLALPIAAGLRVMAEHLRIELPGEQPGEAAERAVEEQAEAVYADQVAGASAVEAAILATALAEQLQEEVQEATGMAEVPVEERRDASDAERPPLPNPAR